MTCISRNDKRNYVYDILCLLSYCSQTERAYQKQPPIFQNSKAILLGAGKKKKKSQRFIRNVGLGFKTPKEVILLSNKKYGYGA